MMPMIVLAVLAVLRASAAETAAAPHRPLKTGALRIGNARAGRLALTGGLDLVAAVVVVDFSFGGFAGFGGHFEVFSEIFLFGALRFVMCFVEGGIRFVLFQFGLVVRDGA